MTTTQDAPRTPLVGRCGNAMTQGGKAARRYVCAIPAGHAGWHRSAERVEWFPRPGWGGAVVDVRGRGGKQWPPPRLSATDRAALAAQLRAHYEADSSESVRSLAVEIGRSYGLVLILLREAGTTMRPKHAHKRKSLT